jgi:hypothetical protein
MKIVCKLAAAGLLTIMAGAYHAATATTAAPAENLVRGVIGPVGSNVSWSGYSVISKIPGAGLIPVTSTDTVFYLGFTAGTRADINNIVLYTTARGGATIKAVTPVKLGGVSNPSIDLASVKVCPVVEISIYNPCIVRLDPTAITLSATEDYYLVVYFSSNNSSNESLGVTQPIFGQTSLTGADQSGDESRLAVGKPIPALNFSSAPFLLMYVMTD